MQSSSQDSELVGRLQKGDIEAFDLLYEMYSKKLYTFGFKYLKSVPEAEELVQSVFLKVWNNHKLLDKELSFRSYLFTIAYNEICNLFRERNYHRKFIENTRIIEFQSSPSTEDRIDLQLVLDQVWSIVDKLPERQKGIFLMSRNEGKSTKQIAEELGLSPGTVDNYISASLKFIRARLKRQI